MLNLNEPFAQQLAAKAAEKVEREFSWQEIAQQTRNIYQNVPAEYRQCKWLDAKERFARLGADKIRELRTAINLETQAMSKGGNNK